MIIKTTFTPLPQPSPKVRVRVLISIKCVSPVWLAILTLLATTVSQAAPIEPYKLYQEHCAKCHGESGQADNWRGYLYFARSFKSPEWQAKRSDAQILEKINQGPRIMPAYEKTLSDEQKAALIRVIRGFGR